MTFAGRLPEEDTLAEIARADLLVLPSFMEGLPIVLMEAMAVGVPVIASRVAGIPELVEDDETGLLFTPSNWDELASRIDLLLGDEALRRRLAESAKAKVASEFDTRNIGRSSSPGCSARTGEHPRMSFGLREAILLSARRNWHRHRRGASPRLSDQRPVRSHSFGVPRRARPRYIGNFQIT